ncbi:MAG: 16S rRNA (adenine(1518)-N(6)/adenine(1519)-N(6))-dimethyltransferase RsmA [bacterium]|nr:16S rRNA (adenine(1518)-N(6)/adenine(1519)-N(6))-dimethyltransferase RsmA [bacterium]MDD5354626.1 16S rRNA (adenine(1518)-N(6)/adenine(1519)-N(6))-dimethyltransferase RsmA [bacterium]MDD5756648.1 16S rRNA (adenine(1518)-N(6)/adenine(1519)-N(6))-dimethyltransferase RsmA [bacterium]
MKKWGQVFLHDKRVALDIITAASLTKNDRVIEIGPGRGVLTKLIAPLVNQLIAVEIDPRLVRELQGSLKPYPQVVVLQQDIMSYQLPSELMTVPFKVTANVPYYITSPIIFQLLDWHLANPQFSQAIIMVQKEVAQRLAAVPGGKEYGVISVMLQFYADVQIIRIVPANCFSPVPKVDSAVIKIDFLSQPREKVAKVTTFKKVVKAAFAQRRKTILNSLKHNYGLDADLLEQGLKEAGIGSGRRAETLSIAEFARLSEVIDEKQKSNN